MLALRFDLTRPPLGTRLSRQTLPGFTSLLIVVIAKCNSGWFPQPTTFHLLPCFDPDRGTSSPGGIEGFRWMADDRTIALYHTLTPLNPDAISVTELHIPGTFLTHFRLKRRNIKGLASLGSMVVTAPQPNLAHRVSTTRANPYGSSFHQSQ